jgi:ribulose bisphosphate carboxylase small subunit
MWQAASPSPRRRLTPGRRPSCPPRRAFPNAYIRLVAFDAARQVQVSGFLVHRPSNAKESRPVADRSVA